MSESSNKDLMLPPLAELPPTNTVPAVECVPVFVDSRGVVHYHARVKPIESTQIAMRATHYRHWLPLSDEQVWEAMYPAEFTDEEEAAVRQNGMAVLKRFLVSAFSIFVLLCLATTDNAIRTAAIQLVSAIYTALTPVLVTCLATPVAWVTYTVFQIVLPIYHLLVAVISFSAYVCYELWQFSEPLRSALGALIRAWSTEFLKEWGNHIVTVWEAPIRYARQYPKEVFLYTLPNKINCFGKYSWLALIIDTVFIISFAWVLPYHLARYAVVFAKILFFALPVLYISPYDRLAFWPALSLLVALEIGIAAVLIWARGYGHFWGARARFTIYRTWEKHFRYTRQTYDSLDWMRRSYSIFYPGWKMWIFMDQWCYDKFMHAQRLKYPHVGTNAFADKTFPVGYKTPKQFAAEAAIEAIDQAARDKKALFWANYKKKHDFYVQVARDHFARAEKMWDAREGEAHRVIDSLRNQRLVDIHIIVKARQTIRPKPVLQNYLDYYVSRNNAVYKPAMDYYNHVWQLPSQIRAQPQARPTTRSKASLLPDYDYFTTLIEQDTAVNLKYGLLFILALSSLTVYSIILAGWSSNSKYAFIGALRSAAQMISYEVAISLILLPVVLLAGSLNITMVVYMQSITVWFLFPLLPAAILFIIAMLAETNRTPFDLPEAEAELVAGYNVDYSALPFAMFFLGEYCNMILISVLFCLLFLGGWSLFGYYGVAILVVKAIAVWFYFIHVRATLPRYRYDQLMDNGWKIFLPIAGGFFIFIVGVLVGLDALPVTTELPLQEISRFAAAACVTIYRVVQPSAKSSLGRIFLDSRYARSTKMPPPPPAYYYPLCRTLLSIRILPSLKLPPYWFVWNGDTLTCFSFRFVHNPLTYLSAGALRVCAPRVVTNAPYMQTFTAWVRHYKGELTVLCVTTALLICFYITWPLNPVMSVALVITGLLCGFLSPDHLIFVWLALWGIIFLTVGLKIVCAGKSNKRRSGTVPARQNLRALFVELFLLSLFLVPLLVVAGISVLHTTLWLAITGSSVVLYLLLPLAANLLAVAVVFLRNPMHSLLALIGVFLNAVVVFISSGAEFLGLVFLIVYVGAVAILFLFVIMLLNVKSLTAGFSLLRHLVQKASFAFAPALTAVLPSRLIPGFFIQTAYSVPLSDVQVSTTAETLLYYVNYAASDVMSFATLYTDQVALFLLITCVLLIAMLGAIVLATVTLEEDEPLASIQYHQVPSSPSTVSPYSLPPVWSGCRGHPYRVNTQAPPWWKSRP